MALQRIAFTNPIKFQGLWELVPPEMEQLLPLFLELERRLTVNQTAWQDDLYTQVAADPSILPDASNGASTASTNTTATQDTVDLLSLENQLMSGL